MLKIIYSNVTFLSLSFMITRGLFFLQMIFLARFFGPEGVGKYSFLFAIGGLLLVIGNFGMNDYSIKEIARKKTDVHMYFSNQFLIRSVLSIVMLLIAIVIVLVSNFSDDLYYGIFVIVLIVVLDQFGLVYDSIFKAFEQMRYSAVGDIIQSIVTVFLVIIISMRYVPFIFVICSFFIGKLFSLLYSIIIFNSKFKIKFKIQLRYIGLILKNSLPFMLTGVWIIIIYRIDIVMLQFLKGSAIVGLYELPYTIIRNLEYFVFLLATAFYPKLSQNIHNKRTLKKLYVHLLSKTYIFGILMLVGSFLFGNLVIKILFGSAFTESFFLLKIVAVGGFFLFLSNANMFFLNAVNKTWLNFFIFLFGMIVNVCLNWLLIPSLSAIGAGIATIVTYFLIFSLQIIFVFVFLTTLNFEE